MLNKLILIENFKNYQFSKQEELIEYLMGDNYYSQTEEEKKELMKLNGLAKCLKTDLEVIELKEIKNKQQKIDVKNKFIIYDEMTYVLSLLITNRVMLLEQTSSNIFTSNLDKTNITDNYIIVNTFAEKLLDKYINAY